MSLQRSIHILLPTLVLADSCSQEKPVTTVEEVELERYKGKWYDIARLPTRFEHERGFDTEDTIQTPQNGEDRMP